MTSNYRHDHWVGSRLTTSTSFDYDLPTTPKVPAKASLQIDEIESKSVCVLVFLLTLADGQDRSDITKLYTDITGVSDQSTLKMKSDSIDNSFAVDSFLELNGNRLSKQPFRRATHFNDREILDQPIKTQMLVNSIILNLKVLFLGVNPSTDRIDKRSTNNLIGKLRFNEVLWNQIKSYHSPNIQGNIKKAIDIANNLLIERNSYATNGFYGRVILYSLITTSITMRFLGRKTLSVLAIVAATINLLFMTLFLGSFSFSQKNSRGLLKTMLEMTLSEMTKGYTP